MSSSAQDQTFRRYGATLETAKAPYDPASGTGSLTDDARYIVRPGIDFMRPWLAIRNGPAFQFPLGLEGFNLTIDPTLGIHKFIGDNKVSISVIHFGEEHFTMSGNFIGDSAPDLLRALRDLVYQGAPPEGKILYVPEIMSYAQRVQVAQATFDRPQDARGRDLSYSIEFVRMGTLTDKTSGSKGKQTTPNPTAPKRGKSQHSVNTDAIHNTLRKIAAWKLGGADKWRTVYNANESYFVKRNIPISKAPDYRLPPGTTIHY